MAGISDKALKSNYAENKYRFQKQELQNKEFSGGSGLEVYEFKYRMDDPQIGRFWTIDPLSDSFPHNSVYAFSENKVTGHIELEGLEAVTPIFGNDIGALAGAGRLLFHGIDNVLGKVVGAAFAPFNMLAAVDESGNAHDPAVKARLAKEAKGYAAETLMNVGFGMAVERIGGSIFRGFSPTINPFDGVISSSAKGDIGESLTHDILKSQYPDANILPEVTFQLDVATMRADFVVI